VVAFVARPKTQDRINYYKIHGCKVERKNREEYFIIVPARCEALSDDFRCKLHGTDKKPLACRRFDENHREGYYITDGCLLK
jgi:hypothetical protein